MTPPPSTKPPQSQILWIIWFALLSGTLVNRFLLGSGPAFNDNWNPPLDGTALGVLLALALVGTSIRWLLLPRCAGSAAFLPVYIVGLAFSEGICLMGIFVFPSLETLFFGASILCFLQYVPLALLSCLQTPGENRGGESGPVKVQ